MIGMRTTIAVLLLASSVSLLVMAEEQPTPATNQNDQASSTESETTPAETQVPAQDTRGGAGLKERKLSDIFEQFVPTETISADNAVPFPTDI